jgi:hypothetical protein
MPEQFSIAARDHGAGISQERLHGMTGRRCLPIVTAELADREEDLRDFLLGRAIALTVEGLQHAARPHPLLMGQPGVRWDHAPVERREKTVDGLDAIKTIDAERHERGDLCGVGIDSMAQHLDMLSVAEVVEEVDALQSVAGIGTVNNGLDVGVRSQ